VGAMTDRMSERTTGRLVAVGHVGLTGLRGKMAQRVSGPVARKTSLSRDEVEAVIGGIFLLVTFIQIFALLRRITRAVRSA
jgi:hypothetical protein